MKKALILTSAEGHLSIAQAAEQTLSKAGFKVKLIDIFSKKALRVYTPFYRYFPSFNKVFYQLGQRDTVQRATKHFSEKWLIDEVKKYLKQTQPDLIISTHFLNSPAIERVLDFQKQPIPFINIMADPWTIHPLLFSLKANYNLVYDKKGFGLGKKYKIPQEKLATIGWLVRDEFYKDYNPTKIRKELGFKKDVFTLLICGGSEGTNFILKIMPAFLTIDKKLQVIIVCGTNRTLYKALLAFKKHLTKLDKFRAFKNISKRLNIKIFRFTDKLPELMTVSDLIVGKAGPNLIFESVALKKPFFAICHIAGQEDGNLPLIKKKKLGFVEERPIEAMRLLKKIIDNPKILEKYRKSIAKEFQYNQKAADNLLNIINSCFT